MKAEKAVGPNEIPIEFLRCLGDVGVGWLTNLFNKILSICGGKVLQYLYKRTKEVFKSVQTMKFWERIVEHRLDMKQQY